MRNAFLRLLFVEELLLLLFKAGLPPFLLSGAIALSYL